MIPIMSKVHLPEPFDRIGTAGTRERAVSSGQALFKQGDATTGVYYLISGGIDLIRGLASGHDVILHRARAGETFAEASLFSNHYHCTAIATRDSRVMECLRTVVQEKMTSDAEFSWQLASRFAMQIQEGRRHVELLSIRSADERILMAMEDGLLTDDIVSFASVIGLAQETVYRALKRLVDNGAIERTARGQYRIAGKP